MQYLLIISCGLLLTFILVHIRDKRKIRQLNSLVTILETNIEDQEKGLKFLVSNLDATALTTSIDQLIKDLPTLPCHFKQGTQPNKPAVTQIKTMKELDK